MCLRHTLVNSGITTSEEILSTLQRCYGWSPRDMGRSAHVFMLLSVVSKISFVLCCRLEITVKSLPEESASRACLPEVLEATVSSSPWLYKYEPRM